MSQKKPFNYEDARDTIDQEVTKKEIGLNIGGTAGPVRDLTINDADGNPVDKLKDIAYVEISFEDRLEDLIKKDVYRQQLIALLFQNDKPNITTPGVVDKTKLTERQFQILMGILSGAKGSDLMKGLGLAKGTYGQLHRQLIRKLRRMVGNPNVKGSVNPRKLNG